MTDHAPEAAGLAAFSLGIRLSSSDSELRRSKDQVMTSAREVARSNPYGKSAVRTTTTNVVGPKLRMKLAADFEALGVTYEAAETWCKAVEKKWEAYAESHLFSADAQRKQTFSGLVRTAWASYYVAGEALGTTEFRSKPVAGFSTCLNLLDPERLSDDWGSPAYDGIRRMGVERDQWGAPVAYHIRDAHPSDVMWGFKQGQTKWRRIQRYSPLGRALVLHVFHHDRPDMTRGVSELTTAVAAMQSLDQFQTNELDTSALRASFAAVIKSEMNWQEAQAVVGQTHFAKMQETEFGLPAQWQAWRGQYYSGLNPRVGKAKVVHLLPNEDLDLKLATPSVGSLAETDGVHLHKIASGAGSTFESLTKDYTKTSYSGARAAMADIARQHAVWQQDFFTGFCVPFVFAWLEELIVVNGYPMLGGGSFYENQHLLKATFKTYGKVMLDPAKEIGALVEARNIGAIPTGYISEELGLDIEEVYEALGREKGLAKKNDLSPADINPAIWGQGVDKTGWPAEAAENANKPRPGKKPKERTD